MQKYISFWIVKVGLHCFGLGKIRRNFPNGSLIWRIRHLLSNSLSDLEGVMSGLHFSQMIMFRISRQVK